MPISYPEIPVSIGDHIRKKRMDLKLFQKDVAKICGVTEDCITNWEKNRCTPQIQFFPIIIKFLGYLPFEVDNTTFPGRLKAYRLTNGLSQRQLGKVLCVEGSVICSWESGALQPCNENLKKVNDILNQDGLLNELKIKNGLIGNR
ncbi:transcriptional regulator [Pedobacter sp. KR3-3]|uniref:Transcriptional regulator n=1 Tax=Pedobacter albus TaxID=3113905 RepID=A0ABU7IDA7_9SPHI|nr:transcriptional regulator [Pedobacter sp. KR3-3]MEE1947261.1 transcriptional regulator [Pedobacter sp. KR3-3]